MDAIGHLNKVAIARLYESARAGFHMLAFGLTTWPKSSKEQLMVMAQANICYLLEGFYPDPVIIGTIHAKLGSSPYTLYQALFQNEVCLDRSMQSHFY